MGKIKINIEIPMLLSAFVAMLTGPVYSNFIIYRTCYVTLGYNETECAMLGNMNNNITEHLEPLVEPEVTVINTVKSVVESSIAIVLCLFMGSWSDKYGRKPVLVVIFVGSLVSSTLVFISSCFRYLSPWYIILCSLPTSLTGGGPASLTVIMSYITDTTDEENRGFRLALLDLIFNLAFILGNSSSSYVFNAINYPGVFALSVGMGILSGAYVIFFLPESRENTEQEQQILDKECEDRSSPKKVAIVDWQISSLHSPTLDLGYFLIAVSGEEQVSRFDEYLKYYHDNISRRIRELGSDPNKLFPYKTLLEHWKKYTTLGFLYITSFLPTMMCDKEKAVNMEDHDDPDELANAFFSSAPENREVIDRRLLAVARYYFKLKDS